MASILSDGSQIVYSVAAFVFPPDCAHSRLAVLKARSLWPLLGGAGIRYGHLYKASERPSLGTHLPTRRENRP
jgi:hypothetical protein